MLSYFHFISFLDIFPTLNFCIMNLCQSFLLRISILLVFVLLVFDIFAQTSKESVSDSLRLKPVQLSDIPIHSAETLIKTKNILKNLITDKQIAELKNSNDSILNMVVDNNKEFLENEIVSKNIRFLENRILLLKDQTTIVENEKNHLSEILNQLSASIKYLGDEQIIWSNTQKEIRESGFSEKMQDRLNIISHLLDSAINVVSLQTEDVLVLLDRSSELSIEMGIFKGNLEKMIRELEEQRLQNDYPTIFNLDYNTENVKLASVIKLQTKTEWKELKSYLTARITEFVLTVIFFILILYLFRNKQNLLVNHQSNPDNYYKKRIGILLSKPVSAALLLTLLATVLFFTNRPPAFRDLIFFIFIIPIIILMRQLLDRKLWIFVYGFALLMFIHMSFITLPPENIFFRYHLLFMALAEIAFIWYFLFRTLKKLVLPQRIFAFIRFMAYTFLSMSIIGLLSSLSGNIRLSLSMVFSVTFILFTSSIIYITTMLLIGVIITLFDTQAALKVNFIKTNNKLIKKRITQILNTSAVIYMVYLLLFRLSMWNKIKDSTIVFLNTERTVGEIHFSIGSILLFFVVIYISILLGKIIQLILEDDILVRISLKKGMPHTISTLVRYSLITFGFFLGISATGIQISSLTVIIGALGVGLGFGLQNIFNNLVSGLILLFDRPIKIGDTIEVGSLVGKVNHIGIRTSNVKTFDGAEVIVPNGQLISNEVINWTLSDQQRRIEVQIGVSYNSNPHEVHGILMEIIKNQKDVLSYPLPQVLFSSLGESSLDFRMLFWTESIGEWLRIKSEVTFKAFDILKENGIEIPFPQTDLHVKSIEQQIMVAPKLSDKE